MLVVVPSVSSSLATLRQIEGFNLCHSRFFFLDFQKYTVCAPKIETVMDRFYAQSEM
jgi:hypothetical protein